MEPLSTTETATSARVAANVRAELAARRESYTDFATALGWSMGAASRRLNGLVKWDVDWVEAAARHFGIEPWSLTAERSSAA